MSSNSLSPQCFNPECHEQFESVNDMVAVPGRGGRSPRHFCEDCAERIRRGPALTDGGVIEREEEFEPREGLEDQYEQTIRQTVKILTDDEDPPHGFHISLHRGDGVGFTTGMSPELVSGTGPTLPAVEMLAQHLSTVHQQTEGMDIDELALLAASHVKKWESEEEE